MIIMLSSQQKRYPQAHQLSSTPHLSDAITNGEREWFEEAIEEYSLASDGDASVGNPSSEATLIPTTSPIHFFRRRIDPCLCSEPSWSKLSWHCHIFFG